MCSSAVISLELELQSFALVSKSRIQVGLLNMYKLIMEFSMSSFHQDTGAESQRPRPSQKEPHTQYVGPCLAGMLTTAESACDNLVLREAIKASPFVGNPSSDVLHQQGLAACNNGTTRRSSKTTTASPTCLGALQGKAIGRWHKRRGTTRGVARNPAPQETL